MIDRPEFTREQEDWICFAIGEWYLEWKEKIAPCSHLLGIAKEDLKEILVRKENKTVTFRFIGEE